METSLPNGSETEFESELPTLQCAKICGSCGPRFGRPCVDSYAGDSDEVPSGEREVAPSPWEEDKTEPEIIPGFLRGFDDDYILDPELGGED